ncbi:MAG: hypothetical protein KDA47_13255, partial [Planctomycetales bacterium]|nr:hypothetical protein [Planctomycetales bacterium]
MPFRVPCVKPPTGTTVPGTTTTSPYTDCQLYCFGQTTTSTIAATTTTTQPTCDSGFCVWKADATATFWETIVYDNCPALCTCAYPPVAPTESCEVYEYGCY